MHLTIDCRCVHPRMGGIGRAALDLVRTLGDRARGHRITMLVAGNHIGELAVPGVHILPVDGAMIDERFDQLQLPSVLAELRPDVYVNTTFSIPAIRTVKAQVSFIHDVVFEDQPEYVEPGLRSWLSRWSRFAATHADHVLTVSDHARERICRVYGVEAPRITRVYNGISPSSFDVPAQREIDRVRAKYGLDQPFILCLSTMESKKGIRELLEGYKASSIPESLVLAGGEGAPGLDLQNRIRSQGLAQKVRTLGFVDEADKKGLIGSCRLFVYPSLYEGFGLPPLEAMALGIPCVVSDRTCLPEIVGEAAITVDVADRKTFGEALVRGLCDDGFRGCAAVAGPARAREFSWEQSADQVLDLCERLASN